MKKRVRKPLPMALSKDNEDNFFACYNDHSTCFEDYIILQIGLTHANDLTPAKLRRMARWLERAAKWRERAGRRKW